MQDRSMAASVPSNNDYFYPGSIIRCVTCHDVEIQGEVTAFDHDTKCLILKQPSSSGKSELNNISLINVDFVQSVEVIKETEIPLSQLSALSSSKLFERYKEEITLKMTLAKASSAGVSNDGIKLFKFLRKAMPVKTVNLEGKNISVMEEVLVNPPYQPENCVAVDAKISNNPLSLSHVKKIVERFHKEERLKPQPPGTT